MGLREGWDEDGRGGRERPQGWRTGRSHSCCAAVFAIISQTRQCIVHVIVACIVMLCVAVLELPFCCTCLGCCKAVSSALVVPYCLPRVAAPLSPAAITPPLSCVSSRRPLCIAFVRHGITCRMVSCAIWYPGRHGNPCMVSACVTWNPPRQGRRFVMNIAATPPIPFACIRFGRHRCCACRPKHPICVQYTRIPCNEQHVIYACAMCNMTCQGIAGDPSVARRGACHTVCRAYETLRCSASRRVGCAARCILLSAS